VAESGEGPTHDVGQEVRRLREENERLRIQSIVDRELAAADKQSAGSAAPHVINIKQVNQSCFSGCAGLLGLFVLLVIVLGTCSG
jgi:hypothetical protein